MQQNQFKIEFIPGTSEGTQFENDEELAKAMMRDLRLSVIARGYRNFVMQVVPNPGSKEEHDESTTT